MQKFITTSSVTAAILLALQGCASSPPPRILTAQERIQQANAIGSKLSLQLEEHLYLRNDAQVRKYLEKLSENLAATVPDLRTAPLEVHLVKDLEPRWRSFGIPGNKIYLSLGLVREVEFENELAAMIALQLGHIVKRHAIQYLDRNKGPAISKEAEKFDDLILPQPGALPSTVDYFGPSGMFAYTESAYQEACEQAANILYNSGYDPRGLVSLLNRFKNQPERSPYEASTVDHLIESARQMIALRAPLRNPIVRSTEFLGIEKRIRQL